MSPIDALRDRLRASRRALGNRDLARMLFAWGVWMTADWALLITVSLLALEVAGPVAVGLVGAVRVLPAAVLSALASVLTDRWSRTRLLCMVYAGHRPTDDLARQGVASLPALRATASVTAGCRAGSSP